MHSVLPLSVTFVTKSIITALEAITMSQTLEYVEINKTSLEDNIIRGWAVHDGHRYIGIVYENDQNLHFYIKINPVYIRTDPTELQYETSESIYLTRKAAAKALRNH